MYISKVLVQRRLDINKGVYAFFIDYNKQLNKIRYDQFIKILETNWKNNSTKCIYNNFQTILQPKIRSEQ